MVNPPRCRPDFAAMTDRKPRKVEFHIQNISKWLAILVITELDLHAEFIDIEAMILEVIGYKLR